MIRHSEKWNFRCVLFLRIEKFLLVFVSRFDCRERTNYGFKIACGVCMCADNGHVSVVRDEEQLSPGRRSDYCGRSETNDTPVATVRDPFQNL